ncbi:nucleotidyl transferase AbiEii/AbiGii toxin family protein [Rhizobium sp. CG5]|uniref:nucleotidyl transferase AbiEii/AbiGii toxin family protein n=1 Tax=Rhizobium sp. CG5 TaxID=2726076 RepID=UPI002033463D|nr:nucleotidyl transferase AbiEii/AbiGii toxin family protein [Rhizobium sp. CG5]MCM2477790.1 nucleotidyl transferase AbiEii/AbiGii toxin family protein [Rhizobium sp. CG5]
MRLTLQALDSVTEEGTAGPSWTFGGGTSLAIDIGHRVSYDVDAFLDSARIIQSLVPIRNLVTRTICWNDETGKPDYRYPGHYLKLIVKGSGEIDFLGASPLIENATTLFEFEEREIVRELPSEVIAKKIYYRGSMFKARDVFDLAGTFLVLPDELLNAAASPFLTPDVYDRAQLRIETRIDAFHDEIHEEVNPTEFGRSYMEDACELALEAIELLRRGSRPKV